MAKKNDKSDKISKREFFNLPNGEVQRMVAKKNKPRTGIFLADGNRRLVMTRTGLTPDTNPRAFYREYVKLVTRCFKENLKVFFTHGLNTLFFPLFGGSLLEREKAYKESVIPELTTVLFHSEKWRRFYREYDIRIKPYGSPERLNREFPGMDLAGKIHETAALTSQHRSHTLYFGFFSTPWLAVDMIQPVQEFIKMKGCEPNRGELIELYYGENVSPADFFINSTRTAGLGALPPLISGKETRVYTLVSPGIFALNRETFRKILYDLLFCQDKEPSEISRKGSERGLEELKEFYTRQRKTVIGQGKRIGGFRVLNVEGINNKKEGKRRKEKKGRKEERIKE
jgi:hypothetical protein